MNTRITYGFLNHRNEVIKKSMTVSEGWDRLAELTKRRNLATSLDWNSYGFRDIDRDAEIRALERELN